MLFPEQLEKLYLSSCVFCGRRAASPDPLIIALWERIHLNICTRTEAKVSPNGENIRYHLVNQWRKSA